MSFFLGIIWSVSLSSITAHLTGSLSADTFTCPSRPDQMPPSLGRFVTIPPSPAVRVSSSLMSPEKYPADPAVLALLTLCCNFSFASVSLLLDYELPEGRNAMFSPWLSLVPGTEPEQKESQ